jgi:GPH family glycoside/pentoside/hexuronide:cation symporter
MTRKKSGNTRGLVLYAYILPAFVIALPTIPVYIHLPVLYGTELGLGLATTGIILLIARIFDTITDPLIGWLSDRFNYRGAHRKPWIAFGAIIAGIGLFKILNPPVAVNAEYLLIWSVVLYGGWTMVAVPYLAWGAELSTNYYERTRVTSWREGVGLLGIVGAGVVAAVFTTLGYTEQESIGAIAWLAITAGVIVLPLLLYLVPDAELGRKSKTKSSPSNILKGLRSLAANGPFVRLLSAWFLNGIANGIPAALFFIYLEHALGAGPDERPIFILTYFVAAISAIPIWLKLSRRLNKHRTWCWAMSLACVAFATVPFIPAGSFSSFAIVCVVTGMGLGADLALPPAIQADVVDYDRWRNKQERTGLQFALWGMSTKLALALSVGIALPVLDIFGFDANSAEQDSFTALIMIYAVVPIVIKIAAIFVVWNFPLTPKKLVVIQHRLSKIKHVD